MRFAYGPTPIEGLDVYQCKKPNAPINIFVHGGAWRNGAAPEFTYLAEPFLHAGAHFVVLDFTNVDNAGGSLFPMVEQVCRAVGWVYRNADKFGGDAQPALYHLAFLRLASHRLRGDARLGQGRPAERHLKGGRCRAACTISSRSAVEALEIRQLHRRDGAGAQRRSPSRPAAPPLILTYGTYETPEFQRQSRDFAAAVKAAGKPVELLVGEGYNHFEMLETLANPYGLLGRAVLKQMKLTTP